MNEEKEPPIRISEDKKTIHIHGVPVHVAPIEECEKCDYTVCSPVIMPSGEQSPNFGGSVIKQCYRCGKDIWFTPSSSPNTPRKICIDCLFKMLDEESTNA